MNQKSDNITYAKSQLNEASRRLEYVHDRVSEIEEKFGTVMLDNRDNELVTGEEAEEVPDDNLIFLQIPKDKTRVTEVEGHIQNVIIDCQMVIELSVKAMFKTVGQDFDYSHDIGFSSGNTQGFNSQIPGDFPRNEEVIRAIFLTQVWEKFYQIAKYGVPELDVSPSIVFEIEDGERALNDASFCVDLAEDLLEFVEETSKE